MTGTTRAEGADTALYDAYAAVYQEHNSRLVAYARALTGNAAVAEDLAAEAHFRVWRRMSAGHAVDNPSAYLTTTVRNLAAGLGRAQREIARDLDEMPQDAERAEAVAADPEQRASHVDLISRLLKELPERWAKALWYAEVEDLPMEAVGAHIGASASTTAVVLTRARERLRQAFLQSQPGRPADEACEPYWKQMPTIVRGTASARRSRTVLEHCDGCADCRARMLALTEANTRLPLLLGPALLGIMVGGGAWFLPAVAGAGAGAVVGTVARAGSRAGSGARHARISARVRMVRHGASPTKVTVYGSAAAAVGIAVAVATMALGSPNPPSHPNAAAAQSRASAQSTAAALGDTQSPAAATPAAKQAASTPTSSAVVPGTTLSTPPTSAVDVPVEAQRETQAAATDPTTSTSPASTPTPAATTTTPTAAKSSTAAATMVADSPTDTASSTPSASTSPTLSPTPSPSQTPWSPSPSPTITPTQPSPTGSGPTSPPYCEFYVYGFCVIW